MPQFPFVSITKRGLLSRLPALFSLIKNPAPFWPIDVEPPDPLNIRGTSPLLASPIVIPCSLAAGVTWRVPVIVPPDEFSISF